MKRPKKQHMRHAKRAPYANPPSHRYKNSQPRLTREECAVLLTDPQNLAYLTDDEVRFYKLYIGGLPLSQLARMTLGSVELARRTLADIEKKVWRAAPKLRLEAPRKDSIEDDYDASAVDSDIVEAATFEDESQS